jgi:RNA 2',3'-cyclic 3'-phosphodiesterase
MLGDAGGCPMTDHQESQLYLFARLPAEVQGHVRASNDLDAARAGRSPVEAGRLHITLAALGAIDAPQDYLAQLVGWVMATIPPFAFRVAFDELIVGPRSALLKASDPLHGALACQAHVAAMLRDYGVDLPKAAMPVPHVTLGYGYRAPQPTRGIDPISWLVEELVLVRSLVGQGRHVVLGEWRLPLRPGESRLPDRPAPALGQLELWPGLPAARIA